MQGGSLWDRLILLIRRAILLDYLYPLYRNISFIPNYQRPCQWATCGNLTFQINPSWRFSMLTEMHCQWSVCLSNVAFATCTGSAVDTLCRLLWISLWPSSHEWDPILVFCLFHQCSFCHINSDCCRHIVPSAVDLFLAWFSWLWSYTSGPPVSTM
jgi:hypothetical protein